jgi:hypothetical protein
VNAVQGELSELATRNLDVGLWLSTVTSLGVAVFLSALLAYHPSEFRRATTREELEQPKSMVLYGLVGCLVGHVVHGSPSLALVIFGLGGLMRFRTDGGAAKGTARLILCALVGVCVGLHAYAVALLATACAWAVIWWLERSRVGHLQVLGVEVANMPATSDAYRRVLQGLGCRIVGETRSPNRGEIQIVFVLSSGLSSDVLEKSAEGMTPEVRATPAWTLG